jgi:hypothetical protein
VEQNNLALGYGFFKNRTIKLHALGWATIEDVWVVAEGNLLLLKRWLTSLFCPWKNLLMGKLLPN